MSEMIKSPYFGIMLSIVMYLIGTVISKKLKTPIANPLLIAMILCVAFLKIFNISYDDYNIGGKYITFLIAPATVAMVLNLYKNIELLKKNIIPVFVGVFAGVLTSVLSVFILAKVFGLNKELTLSIVPKSLTTAIGVALAGEYGGISAVAVVCIVITGIFGAVFAPIVMNTLKIKDPVAKGIGIGTTSHAVGTSKAIEMGPVEGAMSGLAIALAGFTSVIVIPILINIFG
ncbi:LrgB family protein [Peptoniphilaceae bacterium SGI.131]